MSPGPCQTGVKIKIVSMFTLDRSEMCLCSHSLSLSEHSQLGPVDRMTSDWSEHFFILVSCKHLIGQICCDNT